MKEQLSPVVNKKALMAELDTPKVPSIPDKPQRKDYKLI